MIDDVLTDMEKTLRAKLRWTTEGPSTDVERGSNVAAQLREILTRGIQVLHHHPSGRIVQSYILFHEESNRVEIQPLEKSFFSKKAMVRHTHTCMHALLLDIQMCMYLYKTCE